MLETLREYVLVARSEAKIELSRKDDKGDWYMQVLEAGENLYLEAITLTMKMAEIYEDVLEV